MTEHAEHTEHTEPTLAALLKRPVSRQESLTPAALHQRRAAIRTRRPSLPRRSTTRALPELPVSIAFPVQRLPVAIDCLVWGHYE